jgi:Fe-S cluster assembly protein SufD
MSAALATLIARSRREREDWRYTDVEKLLASTQHCPRVLEPVSELPSLSKDASRRQRIVFVDGMWQQDKTQFGDLPATVLAGDATTGYRLTLAAQSCLVTTPIELVFVAENLAESAVKLMIDVGSNASLTILEHHLQRGVESSAQIVEKDIRLGAQSKLVHVKIAHDLTNAAHFARTQVRVESGAYYRNFILMKNTRLMRNEIDVMLAGELAQCGLYGALLLRGHEHADLQTRVTHEAPHGTSRQLFKAVVKEQARGVFQGRIKVAEGAQKADGQQLCRALLLSDQAEMDAKPELEIFADDVACSHGCAIGDLDADAMFYLRTRGLNESEARALLLRAFVDEAIETIQADDARAYVRGLAGGWMDEQD